MRIGRREFLKKAGLGSVTLAGLPAVANALATPALAQAQRGFRFLSVSGAGAQHLIAMGGAGTFDPSRAASPVEGGGSYFHFTPAASPPFPLVASGTWRARLLVGYRELGTYGGHAAGIAEMVIDISRQRPSPAEIRGASLRIVCHLGPGGHVHPGETEGFTLSVPGTDFSAGGTPGPFRAIPSPPPAGSFGLTVFLLPETMA